MLEKKTRTFQKSLEPGLMSQNGNVSLSLQEGAASAGALLAAHSLTELCGLAVLSTSLVCILFRVLGVELF